MSDQQKTQVSPRTLEKVLGNAGETSQGAMKATLDRLMEETGVPLEKLVKAIDLGAEHIQHTAEGTLHVSDAIEPSSSNALLSRRFESGSTKSYRERITAEKNAPPQEKIR